MALKSLGALSRPVPAFRSCARVASPGTSTTCNIWLDDEVIVLSTSKQSEEQEAKTLPPPFETVSMSALPLVRAASVF
jgi:hypothetical protein